MLKMKLLLKIQIALEANKILINLKIKNNKIDRAQY